MLYLQLFWTYLKIGTFTIGGGYVMLSMIEREIVDRKGWIDREEFMNMIALAQAAPGLIAVNSAIFIGWRIGGWRGVIATVLGAVLPSFLIILAIAMVFQNYKDLPAVEAVFKGVRPAVVALIAAPLCRMAYSAKITWATAIIPIAGALLIWLGGLSPVWIIFVTVVATLLYTYLKEKKNRTAKRSDSEQRERSNSETV
ncbi:MAG: chromate transporter [Bacteroidales bacterium]|nr:chromate transporter [Bacteroidales bacterium]